MADNSSNLVELSDVRLDGMAETELPCAARCNCITKTINVENERSFVRLLHECYAEVFTGWDQYQGLNGGSNCGNLRKTAAVAASILEANRDDALIVISGVGSSGRLAYDIVRMFNDFLKSVKRPKQYKYLIAGGEYALYTEDDICSTYLLDDSATQGSQDLKEACGRARRVLYIGIDPCLSSAYIASQLATCIEDPDRFCPVLIGYGPTSLASRRKLEDVAFTVYDVVKKMELLTDQSKGFLINPVFGPEPLAGATDMKSGCGTYIQLASILLLAHLKAENPEHSQVIHPSPLIEAFRMVVERIYHQQEHNLADLVHDIAESVSSGGRVYYLGEDNLGAMAVITAAESCNNYCSMESRAFVRRIHYGREENNNETPQPSSGKVALEGIKPLTKVVKDPVLEIDEETFVHDVIPSLTSKDTVVFLVSDIETIPDFVTQKECSIVVINFIAEHSKRLKLSIVARCKSVLQVCVPELEQFARRTQSTDALLGPLCQQLACRLICNVTEAAAHCRLGKVYRNYLADFRISNFTAFARAIKYIEMISGVKEEAAKQIVLKAIYKKDLIVAEAFKPLSEHLEQAVVTDGVMQVAICCALTQSTVEEAMAALKNQTLTELLS